jgi:hypothetical protein
MNVNGRAKLLNIVEDGKVLKGKIYYSTNVAPKESEPKWETDFINVRIVGKAKKEIDKIAENFSVEKLPVEIVQAQLRNKSYKTKEGSLSNWLEITIFDLVVESQTNVNKSKYTRYTK